MVPWSREETTQFAHKPLGGHSAPAIVTCVLYFIGTCITLFSLIYTKYTWYDVLLASTIFRTVAYGVKAAMLVHYWPALGGVYLAFLNAGYGANLAAMGFLVITWVSANGLHFYGVEQRYLLKWLAILFIISVLMFGPIVGVIAAGLEYGAYDRYVATYGERMRMAASYGLIATNFGMMVLTSRLCLTVFITRRSKAGRRPASATQPERDPRFVGFTCICVCLLAIRGSVGVVGAYSDYDQYGKWWLNDHFFYSGDTLPELLVLCILLWPFNYARMGQAYPRALGQGKDEEDQGQNGAAPHQENGAAGHHEKEVEMGSGDQNSPAANGQH